MDIQYTPAPPDNIEINGDWLDEEDNGSPITPGQIVDDDMSDISPTDAGDFLPEVEAEDETQVDEASIVIPDRNDVVETCKRSWTRWLSPSQSRRSGASC